MLAYILIRVLEDERGVMEELKSMEEVKEDNTQSLLEKKKNGDK